MAAVAMIRKTLAFQLSSLLFIVWHACKSLACMPNLRGSNIGRSTEKFLNKRSRGFGALAAGLIFSLTTPMALRWIRLRKESGFSKKSVYR